MTSDLFVYVMLPGQTSFVTAGRFELSTDRLGNPRGRFVYGRKYLERADSVALDPLLKGLFAALRDAGPDDWGRRVIERCAGVGTLGELDYLLQSPDDRAGALGFGLTVEPPAPKRQFNRTIELARLQALTDALMREEIDPGRPGTGAGLALARYLDGWSPAQSRGRRRARPVDRQVQSSG
jgi:serine/threonine-protein kinase HipA